MKVLLAALLVSFSSLALAQAPKQPAPKEPVTAVQNDNCVKKDKNGKCPPLPKSPKPTPKKAIPNKVNDQITDSVTQKKP